MFISPKDSCDELLNNTARAGVRVFNLDDNSAGIRGREYRTCWTANKHDDNSYWIDIGTFWITGVTSIADNLGRAPFFPFAGRKEKLQLFGQGMAHGQSVRHLCLEELNLKCTTCKYDITPLNFDKSSL